MKTLKRIVSLIHSIIIEKIVKYLDPVIRRRIPNSNLYIYSKLSHVRSNENEMVRIANYLVKCEGDLKMIDVGANIGVVTLLTYNSIKKGEYFCIDGNDDFFPLLQKNLMQVPGSTCEKIYLSDKIEKKPIEIKVYVNTANILESSEGKMTDFMTLDEVCLKNKIDPNFIKIDTDGYDSKIIRGLTRLLSTKETIVIYFEYAPMHQVFNKIEKDPVDIFRFLNHYGFEDFYFYDDKGSFFGHFKISDIELIDQLTKYCLSSCTLYNVLIFHRNNKKFKEIYEAGEKIYIEETIDKWGEWWKKR